MNDITISTEIEVRIYKLSINDVECEDFQLSADKDGDITIEATYTEDEAIEFLTGNGYTVTQD